ncbi:MAG TPA: hypothetical protein PLD20_24825 [Blastocatellia bacterium]|nr:hypothetical protein [Blastocatellia bacterium]HMV82995.1 hypothetical protein [Blastocatellia bacterium]HMX27733.1 hypothetical protein [Blastocatellia bacterium]HMY71728.1 hypothetical protein [Blastocatellia bacterium]HMZ21182.1 hypothetical protein [Blastocatellia bacterium]
MADHSSSQSEWRRDPDKGVWHHPKHRTVERIGNRWRVTGTTKLFYLVGDALAYAEEMTKNRKPEQIELF